MIQIDNLQANIEDKQILKGINLDIKPGEVHAIMGPNGSGKSTLSSVIAGNEDYTVTGGSVQFDGEDLLDLEADERAQKGIFLSFQYPVAIPGVTVSNFIKTAVNEKRKALGLEEESPSSLLKRMRENMEKLKMDKSFLSRSLNDGFSGGEKKRNEIFQMLMLDPKLVILDETDSGLDIDALRIVAEGVNAYKSDNNSVVVITHYQRLLEYIKPDVVHVLHNGQIIKTGDQSLVFELEDKGYDWLIK